MQAVVGFQVPAPRSESTSIANRSGFGYHGAARLLRQAVRGNGPRRRIGSENEQRARIQQDKEETGPRQASGNAPGSSLDSSFNSGSVQAGSADEGCSAEAVADRGLLA